MSEKPIDDPDLDLQMPDFPQPTPEERLLIETWKSVSTFVHTLRFSDVPTLSNGVLRKLIEDPTYGSLAPLFQLWIADNHQLAGELPAAIAAYREVGDRYPERTFMGQAYGAIALEQAADCHERLGQADEAAATLWELLDRFSEAYYPGWVSLRLAQILERAGKVDDAITAYRTAAEALDPPNGPSRNYCDVARRGADRLESSREWIRSSSEELVAELVDALREQDIRALKGLASPTHFTVGMMLSEGCFVETEQVLELLAADLSEGLSCPDSAFRSNRGKIYVPSDGWKGSFLSGPVMFLLTDAPGGYEWAGIILTREPQSGPAWDAWNLMRPIDDPRAPGNLPGDHRDIPEQPDETDGGGPPGTLAPLTVADLKLKCPWPRGEEFYAGGMIRLGTRLAVLDAALAGTTVSAVPIVGPLLAPIIWAAAAAAAPIVFLVTLDLLKDYTCGLGAGGLYYNQNTTHVGRAAWAIDFATFNKGLLPVGSLTVAVYLANNRTFGQPALAVADGIVTSVISSVPTGSSLTPGNSVTMKLVSSKEEQADVFEAFVVALFTGSLPSIQTKYSTFHDHLDGPALIPVSLGMYLRQGARLGLMDDTGQSFIHHLHFELIDNSTGLTVRPTPMDGQTLEVWDDGRCMHSTNVPIP